MHNNRNSKQPLRSSRWAMLSLVFCLVAYLVPGAPLAAFAEPVDVQVVVDGQVADGEQAATGDALAADGKQAASDGSAPGADGGQAASGDEQAAADEQPSADGRPTTSEQPSATEEQPRDTSEQSDDTDDQPDATESTAAESSAAPRESAAITAQSTDDQSDTPAEVKIADLPTARVSIAYDDRLNTETIKPLKGYVVIGVISQDVTSYRVSNGRTTDKRDAAVVRVCGSRIRLIASGTGKAEVLLAPKAKRAAARASFKRNPASKTDRSIDASINWKLLKITVKPAQLDMMFIAGQSNAEGACDVGRSYAHYRRQSVACTSGTVYSTYAPLRYTSAYIAGLSSWRGKKCTKNTASHYVPGSLTGTKSITGRTLAYKPYALTEAGRGKTGFDSALAYRWHALSGHKVWVVNAAVGGTSVAQWLPTNSIHTRAKIIYRKSLQTYRAEVAAGHYRNGVKLLFWLQGERDYQRSASWYLQRFKTVQRSLKRVTGARYTGIIMVRAGSGNYLTKDDIRMTGPRRAQRRIGNGKLIAGVYVVSKVNEQWVTNRGVRNYFKKRYPKGSFTYPMQNASPSLPSKVAQVHSTIHYSQIGHNENGLTAASYMYRVYTGKIR